MFTKLFLLSFYFTSPIYALTNVVFHNNYAIFQAENVLQFELDKQMEILFLETLSDPTFESALYGLRIKHNRTTDVTKKALRTKSGSSYDLVQVVLYKDGVYKGENGYELSDKSDLKNMQLSWTPQGHIEVSIANTMYRTTILSWSDEDRKGNPANITYIALKSKNATIIHQKNSFLWLSNMRQACPASNGTISCDLRINTPEMEPTGNQSTVSKSLRKIMDMKLQSKHSNPQQYYEIQIAVSLNQTGEKTSPYLYIKKNNNTKIKMESLYGNITLRINSTDGTISIRKNGLTSVLFWRDSEEDSANFFHDLRDVIVQIAEKKSSSTYHLGIDESFVNTCKIYCDPVKQPSTWDRTKEWFKKHF